MIVDLHAHYPMHVLVRRATQTLRPHHDTFALMLRWRGRRRWLDRLRAVLLRLANILFNYPRSGQPAVTIPNLRAGGVRVALSVIVVPYDEIGWREVHGAPPAPGSMRHVERQIRWVEEDVRQGGAAIAHDQAELAAILAREDIALIHAIEGGFLLGDTVAHVRANVRRLAELGVAYVTVAHLFWRRVATNAPALPFLPDKMYECLFPEPTSGLCELGIAAVQAMVENGVLVDVTHMSERAIDDSFALLDQIDPERRVPLIATHSACCFGKLEYNLSDRHVKAIADRNGVVGLIACRHYMAEGLPEPQTFDDSMAVIYRHVDRIHQVTGCYEHVALGSDMDGFIKPTLPELDTPARFRFVEQKLVGKYGVSVAQQICSENALRVLRSWGLRVP
jgi:microsomal dipeptidase-like Zn-dependent dipeptidase